MELKQYALAVRLVKKSYRYPSIYFKEHFWVFFLRCSCLSCKIIMFNYPYPDLYLNADFFLIIHFRYYMKARDVLNKYKHMSSFQGIHSDCEAIVVELMQCLRKQLRNPEVVESTCYYFATPWLHNHWALFMDGFYTTIVFCNYKIVENELSLYKHLRKPSLNGLFHLMSFFCSRRRANWQNVWICCWNWMNRLVLFAKNSYLCKYKVLTNELFAEVLKQRVRKLLPS